MGGTLEIQRDAYTAQEQHEIDRGNIGLSSFFRRITDTQLGPEIETHTLTDEGERTRYQGLAGNDGCRSSNDDPRYQEPCRHNIIKRITLVGVEDPAVV